MTDGLPVVGRVELSGRLNVTMGSAGTVVVGYWPAHGESEAFVEANRAGVTGGR